MIGDTSGAVTTEGDNNTSVGYQALATNILGTDNVAIGYQAMHDQDSGSTASNSDHNIAIGSEAMGGAWSNSNKSEQNVSIGSGTMAGVLNNAYYNVVIGKAAGAAMTSASRNVVVGREAFGAATAASDNVAIGDQALDAAAQSETANVAIGKDAMSAINEGTNSGSGAANVDHNVAIGYQAFLGGAFAASGGSDSVDRQSLGNVAIGANALDATGTNPSIGQIAIGQNAATALTTGEKNIAIGYQALEACGSGSNNTIMGYKAGTALPDGANSNTVIGSEAFLDANNSATDNNVAIGYRAGYELTQSNNNVMVGSEAGKEVTTADSCVFIGREAGAGGSAAALTGNNNVCVGRESGKVLQGAAVSNTLIGHGSGKSMQTNSENVVIGADAADAMDGGENENVIIGYSAMGASNGSNILRCTVVGKGAISAGSCTHANEVAIGYNAMEDWTGAGSGTDTAGYNVAIGGSALANNTSGARNVAIGYDALNDMNATDNAETYNIAIGHDSGRVITTGQQNTFVGGLCAADSSKSLTGSKNCAYGYEAGHDLDGGANNNILIGYRSGDNITTGEYNIVIGSEPNTSAVDGTKQIVIGGLVNAYSNSSITMGYGSGSDRIWNLFESNATWTHVSDERYKEDIKDNTDCGLDFINDLRTVTFKWKPKSEIDKDLPDYDETQLEPTYDKKMYGMIAQEVKNALDKNGIDDFGGWSVEEQTGIQAVSQEMFIHPLIKAVQELSAKVEELESKIK